MKLNTYCVTIYLNGISFQAFMIARDLGHLNRFLSKENLPSNYHVERLTKEQKNVLSHLDVDILIADPTA